MQLGVEKSAMQTSFARTLELSRTTTAASAVGALKCWGAAVERFGVDLMKCLVTELCVDGLTESGDATSHPTKVAILLEYAPLTLNNAAKSENWEVEVPITLGLLASGASSRRLAFPMPQFWQPD